MLHRIVGFLCGVNEFTMLLHFILWEQQHNFVENKEADLADARIGEITEYENWTEFRGTFWNYPSCNCWNRLMRCVRSCWISASFPASMAWKLIGSGFTTGGGFPLSPSFDSAGFSSVDCSCDSSFSFLASTGFGSGTCSKCAALWCLSFSAISLFSNRTPFRVISESLQK